MMNMGTLEDYIKDNERSIHHMRGDKDFDWFGLSSAIDIIYKHCEKAHICADVKEKWGAIRFYTISYYNGTLKSWISPGIRSDFYIYEKCDVRYVWEGKNRTETPILKNRIYNLLVAKPINVVLHYFSELDRFVARHIIPKSFIKKVQGHQWEVINDGFQRACMKYPHLVNEICSDVDCYKIIKPNEIGPVDGEKIHNKYWKVIKSEEK